MAVVNACDPATWTPTEQGRLSTYVQQWLVVSEGDACPVNAFNSVLLELKPERVLVEEELQLLVAHVDAQLLKAVDGEVLKPKDVCSYAAVSQAW